MSEINERAIVVFLLKQMGFKSADERNSKRPYYQLTGGKIILFAGKGEPGFYFFPFSDISHAWMVVEWIRANREDIWSIDIGTQREWEEKEAWVCELYFGGSAEFWDGQGRTASEAICIAATHALATDEQLREFGLE